MKYRKKPDLAFAPTFFTYADEIIPELDIHTVVLVFTGTGSGTLTTQPDEVTEAGWFTIEEAQRMALAFTHNDILNAYANT